MSTGSVAAAEPTDQPKVPLHASQRPFWVALLCIGVAGAGNSAGAAVFPPLARELDISEVTVGVIAGLAPLLFMLAAPVWGHVAGRVGPKPVLVTATLGYTIGAALFAFSAFAGLSFWISGYVVIGILSLGRVLNGALGAGTYPAAVSTAVAVVPGDRRAAAISLAAAMLAFLVTPPAGAAGQGKPAQRKPGRVLRPTDARITPFLLITGASFAIVVEISVVLGFSIQDALRLDAIAAAQVTGLMFTILGLFSLIAQLVLIRLKRASPIHAMRIGAAFVLAGLFGLTLADDAMLFGLGCAAIGFGLVGPTTSAACSLALSSEEQGSGAGWMSSARSGGSILGAWSGGILYAIDPQVPYAASAVVALAIAALMLFHPRVRMARQGVGDDLSRNA